MLAIILLSIHLQNAEAYIWPGASRCGGILIHNAPCKLGVRTAKTALATIPAKVELIQTYPTVVKLIQDDVLYKGDIDWLAKIAGEVSEPRLLSQLNDLPRADDDIQYYRSAFDSLANTEGTVSIDDVMKWDDIAAILSSGDVSVAELTDIWNTVTTTRSYITAAEFCRLNVMLDVILELKEDVNVPPATTVPAESVQEAGYSISVWDSGFDIRGALDEDLIKEYTTFFARTVQAAVDSRKASAVILLEDILAWEDIKQLLSDGTLIRADLERTWMEATANGTRLMDLEGFLRWNIRIDQVLDEKEGKRDDVLAAGSERDQVADLREKKSGRGEIDGIQDMQSSISPPASRGSDRNRAVAESSFRANSGDLSQSSAQILQELADVAPAEDLALLQALDQADALFNTGAYSELSSLVGDVIDESDKSGPSSISTASFSTTPGTSPTEEPVDEENLQTFEGDDTSTAKELLQTALRLARNVERCGVGLRHSEDEDGTNPAAAVRAILSRASSRRMPALTASMSLEQVQQYVLGHWRLRFCNAEMMSFYNGVTGFANILPGAKFAALNLQLKTDGYLRDAVYTETLDAQIVCNITATVTSTWELSREESFMTNADTYVLRNYCRFVQLGPFRYEAQENWKALRSMAMNEIVYVDQDVLLLRNCGALGVFYLFERT